MATLYAFLSGRAPFDGSNILTVMRQITEDPPPPLRRNDLPESLERLVMEMLAKNPELRPKSASEIIGRLHAIEDERQLPRTPASIATIGDRPPPVPPRRDNTTIVRPPRVEDKSAVPPLPEPRVGRSSRARRTWIAASIFGVLAAATIAIVLIHQPSPPPVPKRTGAPPTAGNHDEALPPDQVKLDTATDGSVLATWRYATGARFSVTTFHEGSTERRTIETTARTAPVGEAIPGQRWCISIVAILASDERSQPTPVVCA